MIKHKVNKENVDDKYKFLVKDEMTNQEISNLGAIIIKDKLSNLKMKIGGVFHRKKSKKNH